ncbi:hypothetical protein BSK51_30595 [Paenibacillus odorifer]|uniref:Transposase n=1 Tax=Paenibacillus odorifer TaxID=189426 RepID=A0ABX3H3I9_9BACL|nr:hypothetical protein BSK51_30595 [Paenibacillus odorifer]
MREFIKDSNLVSANNEQNALKDLFTKTIQEMLEAEMDTHLGYGSMKSGRSSHQTVSTERVGKR